MAYALSSDDPNDKLEEDMECTVCLGTLRDPTTLPCLHSFCKVCLESIVEKRRKEAPLDRPIREFNCPNCRSEFTLEPDETVANRHPKHPIRNKVNKATTVLDGGTGIPCSHNCSYSVARCVTCEKFLCQECLTAHNNYLGHSEHSVLSMPTMEGLSKHENHLKTKRKMFCKELGHEDKALKFYCETCDKLICRYCMDFKHYKQGHTCRIAKEIAHKNRELLAASNKNLKNLLEEGEVFLKQLSLVTKRVDMHAQDAKSEFGARKGTTLKLIHDGFERKCKELNDKVDEIQGEKLQKLKQHEDKTKAYVTSIQQCTRTSIKLLDEGTDEEIISLRKTIHDNEEKLVAQRSNRFKVPVTDLNVHYSNFNVNEMHIADILENAIAIMAQIEEGKLNAMGFTQMHVIFDMCNICIISKKNFIYINFFTCKLADTISLGELQISFLSFFTGKIHLMTSYPETLTVKN